MGHVSLITLGVSDVESAARFYEELGWRRSAASVAGVVAFMRGGATVLSLFGRQDLAADAGLTDTAQDRSGHHGAGQADAGPVDKGQVVPSIALAMNVTDSAAVDATLAAAVAAGAVVTEPAKRAEWGGYAGYFCTADGHLWEVAHNPGFVLHADGSIGLPDE